MWSHRPEIVGLVDSTNVQVSDNHLDKHTGVFYDAIKYVDLTDLL